MEGFIFTRNWISTQPKHYQWAFSVFESSLVVTTNCAEIYRSNVALALHKTGEFLVDAADRINDLQEVIKHSCQADIDSAMQRMEQTKSLVNRSIILLKYGVVKPVRQFIRISLFLFRFWRRAFRARKNLYEHASHLNKWLTEEVFAWSYWTIVETPAQFNNLMKQMERYGKFLEHQEEYYQDYKKDLQDLFLKMRLRGKKAVDIIVAIINTDQVVRIRWLVLDVYLAVADILYIGSQIQSKQSRRLFRSAKRMAARLPSVATNLRTNIVRPLDSLKDSPLRVHVMLNRLRLAEQQAEKDVLLIFNWLQQTKHRYARGKRRHRKSMSWSQPARCEDDLEPSAPLRTRSIDPAVIPYPDASVVLRTGSPFNGDVTIQGLEGLEKTMPFSVKAELTLAIERQILIPVNGFESVPAWHAGNRDERNIQAAHDSQLWPDASVGDQSDSGFYGTHPRLLQTDGRLQHKNATNSAKAVGCLRRWRATDVNSVYSPEALTMIDNLNLTETSQVIENNDFNEGFLSNGELDRKSNKTSKVARLLDTKLLPTTAKMVKRLKLKMVTILEEASLEFKPELVAGRVKEPSRSGVRENLEMHQFLGGQIM